MGFFDSVENGINKVASLGDNTQPTTSFNDEGFSVPATPQSDGTGLPYTRIQGDQKAINKRRLMQWYVPEFGVIKMYINPSNVAYSFKKAISKERTKGGYVLQYWGEELTTLRITGTTGTSGIEGINMLEEIYRAEQYAFDAVGLTMSAANSASGVSDFIQSASSGIGGLLGGASGSSLGGAIGDIGSSILGLDPSSQNLIPTNIPSLAYLAFGVELFWSGWVFRGYFTSFDYTESVQSLGLFEYNMEFVVTQKRGYRTNYLPWHKSANSGPSGDAIPYSFKGMTKP